MCVRRKKSVREQITTTRIHMHIKRTYIGTPTGTHTEHNHTHTHTHTSLAAMWGS